MNKRRFQRATLLTCGLFLVIVAVFAVPTWRAWRQAQLNQSLITAILLTDPPAVVRLLHQGADANARGFRFSDSQASTPTWRLWLNTLSRKESVDNSALELAEENIKIWMGTHSNETYQQHINKTVEIIQFLLQAGAKI